MSIESPPELVEMIDDDWDVFGDHSFDLSGNLASRDTGGSRWVAPAAALALITIVGYGIASPSATSTATPAPTIPGLIKTQYYVADAPSGFDMYLAEARDDGGAAARDLDESGPAQLWATSDASATEGSWFLVSRGSHHATGENSYRTTVDGIEVVIEHDPPTGQSRLAFTKDGHPLEIIALGWVDRQLVRLVRSVSVDDSEIRFSDRFFETDHKHILDSDPAAAMSGLPVARVGYTTGLPARLAKSFTITVGGDNISDRSKVLKFALSSTSSFAVGDLPAIVGQSVADPTVSVAQWRDGERLITMQGNVGPKQLESIAQTVHQSSKRSVRKQLDASKPPEVPALGVLPKTIASGTLGDGSPWTIQVSTRNPSNASDGYLWWIGQPGDSAQPTETRISLPTGKPTIETIVEHGRTYVLAKVPLSMTGAQLHINPTGRPSTVVPLLPIDPSLADNFTATVFFEPVPFSARIVDSSGATVATWPTL
ncbi:MAG: hypothetical protein QOH53_838 [Ilumatobacteraceae bacterium]